MFKKMLLVSALYVGCANASYAGAYIGGSVGVIINPGIALPAATIFGGYGDRLEMNKRIYLGGELSLSAPPYSFHSANVAASVITGFMVTDETMIYTRLGAVSTLGQTGAAENGHKQYYSFNPFVQYGVGVQTKIAEHWDFRGEYQVIGTSVKHGQYTAGLVYKFG